MKTLLILISAFIAASVGFSQTLSLTPINANGVFSLGAPVAWNVGFSGGTFTSGTYTIKKFGGTQVASGTIDLTQPNPQITVAGLTEPATLLADLRATPAGGSQISALGGAITEQNQIRPSLARPADFDSFWASKIAALNAVPMNTVITQADSGNVNVLYYKLEFDNYNGQKIYAQMARPLNGTSFPAIITMQYAGVYGLPKTNVTNDAANGWLAINVMAHPYPYDQPASYYTALEAQGGALYNYTKIGATSRDTSYFLGMNLGNLRVASYVCGRADWNGQTLVATGTSQGGYQAIMLAGCEPRVNAVLAKVPAGAETAGNFAGRALGWPYWTQTNGTDALLIKETSRYYDIVNFAPHTSAPALIGMGLIDTTCPASGVSAMINELGGSKEISISPLEGHSGALTAFGTRRAAWLNALRVGSPAPVANLLAAPTVQATATSPSSVLLQWTNNAVTATGFVLEYTTTSGSGWQTLAQPAVGTTTFSHTGLTAGTPYYYRIRAIAPPTATPPVATTTSPASNNVLATVSTLAEPPAEAPPRVFYRLRIEQAR